MLPPTIRFIQRGWFNSNSILILGTGGPIIVDTGHRTDAPALLHLIRAAGVEPAHIQLIVNTHSHWDHHGGNELLQQVSGAPVAASVATADLFARNDRHAMWLDYFGTDANPTRANVTWQPGEDVLLAGLPFRVIPVPGHAPDMIALYQPDYRLLLSADALHEQDCGVINTAVHGPQALDHALTTTETLLSLDISLALPGHGPLLTNPHADLRTVLRRLQQFQADPERMTWHLVRRVLMASLLEQEPVGQEQFIATVSHQPWLQEYAPRCGFAQPMHLVQQLIQEYLARHLVAENDGLLRSCIPR